MPARSTHAWEVGEPDPVVPGTAGEVMTSPVITTAVDTSVEEALRLMRHHDVHHLLLEDRGRVVAVVSDRDLARQGALASRGEGPTTAEDVRRVRRPVFQVAQFALASAHQSEPVAEVARRMLTDGVSSLPVLNEAGEIAGILTSRDLLRYLAFGHLRHLWRDAS